jgi:SAM-dependent methyltransferase
MHSKSWLHRTLLDSFPDTWGIDLSQDRVQFLTDHGIRHVFVADAEAFSLDRQFDSIVAGELIEHLGNPRLFLERSVQHLKPGGTLILTTPYVFGLPNLVYAWAKFPRTCSNDEHTSWFCPRTLHTLAHSTGLQITHWRLIYDFPDCRHKAGIYSVASTLYKPLSYLLPVRVAANCSLFVLKNK